MKKNIRYFLSFISIILGILCFITFNIIGSEVAPDGTLVEPFFLIPTGFILIAAGVIAGLVMSFWALFRNPRKIDKWILGILVLFTGFSVLYLTASMKYISEKEKQEIADRPSREPYENCKWEKVKGAGLEFWAQNCDFNGRKIRVGISETLPGAFVEEMTKNGPVAISIAIQVFDLKNGKIEDVLPFLRNLKEWDENEKARFTKDEANSTPEKTRYTLMPSGEALKRFEELSKQEPITDTCAGYGMGNSGVRYFEIHSSNPKKAIFVNIGQELPLFDEKTIIVK